MCGILKQPQERSSSMSKKARKYHPTFKFRVVLDSFVKGNVSEIARKYEVAANQLSTWRRKFLDSGHIVFQTEKSNKEKNLEKKVTSLENLIGKKEIEINLLKKYLDFYVPQNGS
jgi:transposase-like protein